MQTVFVGMSGGVDSAVAAAMLKEQGYNVQGVTLRLKPGALADGDIADAEKIADVIGIKLHVLDLREQFYQKVISYFMSEYLHGATPNPCVICNSEIKFGAMLDYAVKNGADFLATGHYASIKRDDGKTHLLRSKSGKDQSYFLCKLSQYQLSHAMFPLDGMEKAEIRCIAQKLGLPVAQKRDSQEICFVPNDDYAGFIRLQGISGRGTGNFVNTTGEVIGEHSGIINYTIGQRKGLGAFGKPMFVTGIDYDKNTITLGEDGEQYSSGFAASKLSTACKALPGGEFLTDVKIRFRAKPAQATAQLIGDGRVEVRFKEPQRSVTPGQFAAFYDGDEVLGGARIDSTF